MKIKQIGKHASVVQKLRTSCRRPGQSGDLRDYDVDNVAITMLADKLDVIGEALAYLIEKKHSKRKIKLARRKRKDR